MGIVRAALSTVSGALSDQFLEAVEPGEMGERTVFTKGVIKGKKRGGDIISNGSVIHVYDNQFMMLVDGGKIQIDAASEIIGALGLGDTIKIMVLVKDDHHNTNALMDADGSTFDIDKNSGLFFLLTRMQDEVHRTAISYHRKLRSKAQTKSILDEIEGIGPKRKKTLLKEFGSFTKLKNASAQEIAGVVPADVAQRVYDALHTEDNEG